MSTVQREEILPIFTAPPAVKGRKAFVAKVVSNVPKLSTEVKLMPPTVVHNPFRGMEKPKGREERKQRQQEIQMEGDDETRSSQWKLEDPVKLKRFTGNVESEIDGQMQYLLLEIDEKTNSLNVIRPVYLHLVPDITYRAPQPTTVEEAEDLNKQREKAVASAIKSQGGALKKLVDMMQTTQSEGQQAEVPPEEAKKQQKKQQILEDYNGRTPSAGRSVRVKHYEWRREDNDEELGADDDKLDEFEEEAVDPYEQAQLAELNKKRKEQIQKKFFEASGKLSGLEIELLEEENPAEVFEAEVVEEEEEQERTKRGRGDDGEEDYEEDDADDDDDDEEDYEDDDDDLGRSSQPVTRTKRVKLTASSSAPAANSNSTQPSLMGMIDSAAFNPKAVVVDAFKRAAAARGVPVLDLQIPFTELRTFIVGASTFDDNKKNAIKFVLPTICRRDDQKPPNLQLLPSALV